METMVSTRPHEVGAPPSGGVGQRALPASRSIGASGSVESRRETSATRMSLDASVGASSASSPVRSPQWSESATNGNQASLIDAYASESVACSQIATPDARDIYVPQRWVPICCVL